MLSLSVIGCTSRSSKRERAAFVSAAEELLKAANFDGSWVVVYSGRRKAAGGSETLRVGHVERGSLQLTLLTGDNGHRFDCWLKLPKGIDVDALRSQLMSSLEDVPLARNGRFAL